jgi:hypothetical protein
MAVGAASVNYASGGFLRVSDVISRGFGVWQKIIWPCGVIYGVALVPGLVNTLALQQHKLTPRDVFGWRYWGIVVVAGVFGLVARAIVIQASAQVADDGRMHLSTAIDKGMGRFLPLLAAWLLAGVALMFASLLLLVPALMLWTAWYVLTPVCVLEGLGPVESLKRSAALTKGNRWRIFGLILILLVFGGIAAAIPMVGAKLSLGGNAAAVVQVVCQALVGVYGTAVLVVAYQDLRSAQEGVGGGRIASVFD